MKVLEWGEHSRNSYLSLVRRFEQTLKNRNQRKRSADFVHKLEIALKEGRETKYWLRLLIATELISEDRLLPILGEINELIKIIAAIVVKSKQNRQQ